MRNLYEFQNSYNADRGIEIVGANIRATLKQCVLSAGGMWLVAVY
jgi:hypothetical protein